MRRMPAADVQNLVDEWRTRKVNAPLAMVSGLLQRSGKMPHWCKMVFRQKLDGGAEASTSDLLLLSYYRWRTLENPSVVVGGYCPTRLDLAWFLRVLLLALCRCHLLEQSWWRSFMKAHSMHCHYCFESPVVRRHIAEGYWQCLFWIQA